MTKPSTPWSQVISCRDVLGRRRAVRLVIDGDELVLQPPPGEVIRILPEEVEMIRRALADGRAELLQRQQTRAT